MAKLDVWIRWTYRCNGWMWSVMRGATMVVEGCEPTQALARSKSNEAMAGLA